MAAIDAVAILLFAHRLARVRNYYEVMVAALLVYCLLQWATVATFPGIDGAAQGIRKTFIILMAVSVGKDIKPDDRGTVLWSIVAALTYVCLYGIKQSFYFDSFDKQLLAVQSSDLYSNMIGGQQRSISLLSGAFHLGIASCILAVYAVFGPLRRSFSRIFIYTIAVGACYASLTRTFLILIFAVPLLALMIKSKLRFIIGMYGISVIVLVADLASDGAVSNLFINLMEDERLGARSSSYVRFIDHWVVSPLNMILGYGPGSAGSGLSDTFHKVNAVWIEPHNIFLKYLFELGLPVGVLTIVLFGIAINESIRNSGRSCWFIFSIVTILIAAGLTITSVEVWPINLYIGIIIGMHTVR